MRRCIAVLLLLSLWAAGAPAPRPQAPYPTERINYGAYGFYPNWDVPFEIKTNGQMAVDKKGFGHYLEIEGPASEFPTEPPGTVSQRRIKYRRQAVYADREIDGFTSFQVVVEEPSLVHSGGYQDYFFNLRAEFDGNGVLHVAWIDGNWNYDYSPLLTEGRMFILKRVAHMTGTPNPNGSMTWSLPTYIVPDTISVPESLLFQTHPMFVLNFEMLKGVDGEIRIFGIYYAGVLLQNLVGPHSNFYRMFTWGTSTPYQVIAERELAHPWGADGPIDFLAVPAAGSGFHVWYTMSLYFASPDEYRYLPPGGLPYQVIPWSDFPSGGLPDASGELHLWKNSATPGGLGSYKVGLNSAWGNVPKSIIAMAQDDRQQFLASWYDGQFRARVRNPDPAAVAPTWWDFGPGIGQSWSILTGVHKAYAAGEDGAYHVVTPGVLRHTREFGIGVHDPAAMLPVFDGGAADVVSGNLHIALPLISMAGLDPLLPCTAIYNSLDAESGLLGRGWKLSYEISLRRGANAVSLRLADGRTAFFVPQPGLDPVNWYPPSGFGSIGDLWATSPDPALAEYTLTQRNGQILRFNTKGKLRRIDLPTGNALELYYNADGLLVEVKDQIGSGASGRSVQLEYSDEGTAARVKSVRDPEGRNHSFIYADGRLTSIKSPGYDLPWEFNYATASNFPVGEKIGLMRKFELPSGRQWTLRYLPDGRIKEVEDPLTTTLAESAGPATAPVPSVPTIQLKFDETSGSRHTELTDRRGNKTKFYKEDGLQRLAEIHDSSYLNGEPGIVPTKRSFSGDGSVSWMRDRRGKQTTLSYEDPPLTPWVTDKLISISEETAPGVTNTISYTYSTDGFNNVASTTTTVAGVSRATNFSYDAMGRLTSIAFPNVTLPDTTMQSGVTRTMQYQGPRGQLSKVVDEEGGETVFGTFDSVTGLARQVLRPGAVQGEVVLYNKMGYVLQQTLPRGGMENTDPLPILIEYDGAYRVTRVTDSGGSATLRSYDSDGRLASVSPPSGGTTTFLYDSRGIPSGGSGPDGSWSQWVDNAGNVRRLQDVRGFQADVKFDFAGRAIESIVPGGSTQLGGGSGGPAEHKTQVAHDVWDATAQAFYSLDTEVSATSGNRVTKTWLDHRGRPKQVIAPDGITKSETIYDELDRVVATQVIVGTSLQTCTVVSRDARDRVFKTTVQNAAYGQTPTQKSESWAIHNKVGAVVKAVDPLGSPTAGGYAHKSTFIRDARQRVTHVLDGLGNIVQQTMYGEDDLPTEIWAPDPSKKSTTLILAQRMNYTARKELRQQLDSAGTGATLTYGLNPGQIRTVTDALSRVSRTNYDISTQRPIETIEAEGNPAQRHTFHTWANGLLTETKVLNPATMAYTSTYKRFYDKAGRMERFEAPLVAAEQFSFNDFGQLSQKTQGPKTVQHTYNALGQATASSWSGSHTNLIQRTYNGLGLPASVSEGTRSNELTYDLWKGTLKDEIFRVGGQVWKMQTHATDAAGNPVELLDAENKIHAWPVDVNNRPTEVRLANKTISQTFYTPGGLIDKEVLKNDAGSAIATTVHAYDTRGRRIRSQTIASLNSKVLSDYGYVYNDAGEVTKVDYGHLGTSFNLTNDGLSQISGWSTPGNGGGTSAPPFTNSIGALPTGWESTDSNEAEALPAATLAVPTRTVTYTYDAAGNRRTEVVDGVTTTYGYNEASQLVSETSSAKTITHQYDTFGNEIAQATTVGGNTTTEAYGYNHLNMLSTYSNSGSGANWQYDVYPTGERYAKTNLATNVAEVYIHRGWDVATQYTKTGGAAPVLANTFAQGLSMDSKVMRLDAAGTRRYSLGDAVGTLGTTLNELGQVADRIIRDPFGAILAGGAGEPFAGIAGLPTDSESGLDYVRYRMYRSRTGRFTQTDPILGNRSTDHYAYASNNPISRIDPMGLQDASEIEWSRWKRRADSLGFEAFQDPDQEKLVSMYPHEQLMGLNGYPEWIKKSVAASAAVREEAEYQAALGRADQEAWTKEFGGLDPGQRVTKYQRNMNDPLFRGWFEKDMGVQAHLADYEKKFERFVGIGGTWWFPMVPGAMGGSAAAGEVARRSAMFARGRLALQRVLQGPGTWAKATEAMSARAAAFQAQITGKAVGEVYLVGGVKFDAFKQGVLIDAKGPGYATFVRNGKFMDWFKGADGLVGQAQRQLNAARGAPIRWHVAEESAADAMRSLFRAKDIKGIDIVHTPGVP